MPSQAPQGRGRKRRAPAGVFPGASQAGSTGYSNLPTLMGLGVLYQEGLTVSQGKESRKREMSGSRIDVVQWSVCPDRFEYGERKRWQSMHDG